MKKTLITWYAVLALAVFLTATSSAVTIYTDDFESGGVRPNGWLNRLSSPATATYIKEGVAGESVHSGERAISISCPASTNDRWYLGSKNVVPVVGGETYTLTAWVKAELLGGSEAYISMDWLDQNKKRIGLVNSDRISTDQDWMQLSVTGATKPGAAFIRIVFYASASVLGSEAVVTFDDCEISAASAAGVVSVQEADTSPVALYGIDAVNMWKCPMPNPDLPGAGYPDLPGVEHHLIFDAMPDTGGYNHHATMVRYNGLYYAMWSNQPYGEDAPGQRVLYSVSNDGKNWKPFRELFSPMHPVTSWENTGINLSANHWFVQDGKLYARAWCGATVAWSDRDQTREVQKRTVEFCYAVRKKYNYLYREILPGGTLGPVASFTPEELPDDILVPVGNMRELYPEFVETPLKPETSDIIKSCGRRLCEPVYYKTPDGEQVLIFRDDNFSHRKWVSFSKDWKTWTPAAPTDIPDSPSASAVLTLEDGTILLFGNHMAPKFDSDKPRHYGRDPLMVSISRDGKQFTKTYAVRSGKVEYSVPPEMVKGRGGGGAQYPSVILENGTVFVIYSMGKEDIWVSTFPLSSVSH